MAIQARFYSENFGFPFGSSQDVSIMENACGGFNQFCHKPEKQQFEYQQQLQNMHHQKNNPNGHHQSMTFSQNLASQVEKQRLEIDRYISLQNERLRWALQEQRKQQLVLVLKKYEAKTQILLGQKDAEIAKAANRTMELEDFLRKMEMEKQAWQRVAKENEEMVLSLNNTIEQLKESACLTTNEVEDAESCCDVIENKAGEKADHEVVKQENAEEIRRKMICKACNFGCSCIIILPCRHLCLCKACETFLDSCPLCGVVKKASIEALI